MSFLEKSRSLKFPHYIPLAPPQIWNLSALNWQHMLQNKKQPLFYRDWANMFWVGIFKICGTILITTIVVYLKFKYTTIIEWTLVICTALHYCWILMENQRSRSNNCSGLLLFPIQKYKSIKLFIMSKKYDVFFSNFNFIFTSNPF